MATTHKKSDFVFGKTVVRGIHASDDNPQRDGVFVEMYHVRGTVNPGLYVRVTDGHGKFWSYPIESVEIVEQDEKQGIKK